jgi:hypothetical protein
VDHHHPWTEANEPKLIKIMSNLSVLETTGHAFLKHSWIISRFNGGRENTSVKMLSVAGTNETSSLYPPR